MKPLREADVVVSKSAQKCTGVHKDARHPAVCVCGALWGDSVLQMGNIVHHSEASYLPITVLSLCTTDIKCICTVLSTCSPRVS